MKRRVVQVVDSLAPGGAERMAVDIANLLDREAYSSYLCTTRADGPLAEALSPDVGRLCLHRRRRWDMKALFAFGRWVQRERIAVLHSHGISSMTFVSAARALTGFSARHVFHNHLPFLDPTVPASTPVRLAVRFGVDANIGVDARLTQWARRWLPLTESRILLIRNGIDLERFQVAKPLDLRAQLHLPEDATVLVMLANFRPQKDHALMLQALAQADADVPLHLVLIGHLSDAYRAYWSECEAVIQKLGLNGRVHMLGERTDIPEVLAACDVGVLSSSHESGPLALLEYMASGLPYVVTDTGEITQAVKGTDTGFIVPPGDALALAKELNRMAQMGATERKAMGCRGRELVIRQFDQQVTVSRIAELYDQLVVGYPAA